MQSSGPKRQWPDSAVQGMVSIEGLGPPPSAYQELLDKYAAETIS